MPDIVRRRLFDRILVWQPASGTIIDLPTRYVLPLEGPSEEEEYAALTSGSKRPIRRTNRIQIPVTANELALMGEVLNRTKCPVKAAFIGGQQTDNWMWLEETRLQVVDPDASSGLQVQKMFDLENSVFHAAIWESNDLIGGIPWQGTKGQTATEISGDPIRLEPEGNIRSGYLGPGWEVQDTGDTVDMAGNANLSQGASLTFQFPAWGATLRVQPLEKFSLGDITITARDFNGNSLDFNSSTQSAELTLPDKTWKVEISISDSTCRPRIVVKDTAVNQYAVIQAGGVTPDCSKVADPDYTTLPTPNEAPEWEERGVLIWGKENTAPTFTTLNDFETFGSNTGADNTSPTFTTLNNFEVFESETTFSYTTPTIGATTALYTANGGFGEIIWSGLGWTSYADNNADGELAVDEDESYIFLAEGNGLYRYDQAGQNRTFIGGNDPFGVAVDHLTSTVYFTEKNETGVFKINYDGTGQTKVVDTKEKGISLAVAPDAGSGGYIFGAYSGALVRWDIDGSFRKELDTSSVSTNQSTEIRKNVHLHLGNSVVFYGTQTVNTSGSTTYTDKVKRVGFDGGSPTSILNRSAGTPYPDPNNWTILQDEAAFVRVENVENADANVITRNLDGSNPVASQASNVDTGAYVVSAQSIT